MRWADTALSRYCQGVRVNSGCERSSCTARRCSRAGSSALRTVFSEMPASSALRAKSRFHASKLVASACWAASGAVAGSGCTGATGAVGAGMEGGTVTGAGAGRDAQPASSTAARAVARAARLSAAGWRAVGKTWAVAWAAAWAVACAWGIRPLSPLRPGSECNTVFLHWACGAAMLCGHDRHRSAAITIPRSARCRAGPARPAAARPALAGADGRGLQHGLRHSGLPGSGGPVEAPPAGDAAGLHGQPCRSEEHTSELQSHLNLVCRLLLEKKKLFSHTAGPTLPQ